MGTEYENLKAYFCKTCNVLVRPFEMETLKDKNGEQEWGHKQCKTRNIIRVPKEKNIEPRYEPINSIPKEIEVTEPRKPHRPKKKVIDDSDIKEIDDLFD